MRFPCEQRANEVLESHLHPLHENSFQCFGLRRFERRKKPRLSRAFPARVWGVDHQDKPFGVDCLINNISASGVHLTVPRQLKSASQISLVVRVYDAQNDCVTTAISGEVIRAESEHDGRQRIAISTDRYTFL